MERLSADTAAQIGGVDEVATDVVHAAGRQVAFVTLHDTYKMRGSALDALGPAQFFSCIKKVPFTPAQLRTLAALRRGDLTAAEDEAAAETEQPGDAAPPPRQRLGKRKTADGQQPEQPTQAD